MRAQDLFSGKGSPGGTSPLPDPEIKTLQVGPHTIRTYIAGKGHIASGIPPVVFENGLGGSIEDWDPLLTKVAEFAPVFAYDRPGLGESLESDFEPSPVNVTSLLGKILRQLDLAPPYILVGFSLGGPYARMHAAAFQDDVAGIVYIDPMDFTQTLQSRLEEFGAVGNAQEVLDEYDHVIRTYFREFQHGQAALELEQAFALTDDGFSDLNEQAPAIPVPQVILSSTMEPVRFGDFSFDFDAWAKLSTRNRIARLMNWVTSLEEGYFVVTPSSPHKIHSDDPQLVTWAIKRVMFPDPSPKLIAILQEGGEEEFIAEYRRLKAVYPPDRFGEELLNYIGYRFLYNEQPQEALIVLKLNVVEFPEAFNPFDSLGECYLALGESELALKNYARSLELDPKNKNAENKIKELQGLIGDSR